MANFPAAVSTNANLYIAVNGLQTTLAASCTSGDTTLTLTSTTGFPTTGLVTIDNTEVVSYTGVSGATLTGCTRGADGTTAAAHPIGVTVGLTVVAAHHNLLKDEVIAVETILGTTLTNPATPAATATSLLARDANVNARANHMTENLSSIATAGGTTVLTAASSHTQQFTGVTNQTVTLPDATTLTIGFEFTILNRSTGVISVNNNGGTLQQNIAGGGQNTFTVTAIGTTNGTWDVSTSSASITSYREDYVVGTALNNYTGSATVFNLVTPYNVGAHSLIVTLDGDVQTIGATIDYQETNSTTVTFNNALVTGEKVSFIFQTSSSSGGTVNSGTAGQIAYYPATAPTVSGLTGITATQLVNLLNLLNYRRPNLVYSSGTVVSVETGLDGTSGDATILFPDGNLRSETSSSRYQATTSQNAVFTNATLGSNQGGIRSGSVAANTWYACYAVKVTTFAANWVMVLDTVLPTQANYATLNSNFGTSGWVYLGLVRYGDQGTATTSIVDFIQSGNQTFFRNATSGTQNTAVPGPGLMFATSAGTTGLTYTYSSGTSGATLPSNITFVFFNVSTEATTGSTGILDSGNSYYYGFPSTSGTRAKGDFNVPASKGIRVNPAASSAVDILVRGFTDGVLGVGSNPVL